MALHIFTVTVETEHQEGKFVSADEIRDLIMEELARAEPSELSGDEGTVAVTSFEVAHDDEAVGAYAKAAKAARAAARRERALLTTQLGAGPRV